jgi:hypothetical protein
VKNLYRTGDGRTRGFGRLLRFHRTPCYADRAIIVLVYDRRNREPALDDYEKVEDFEVAG